MKARSHEAWLNFECSWSYLSVLHKLLSVDPYHYQQQSLFFFFSVSWHLSQDQRLVAHVNMLQAIIGICEKLKVSNKVQALSVCAPDMKLRASLKRILCVMLHISQETSQLEVCIQEVFFFSCFIIKRFVECPRASLFSLQRCKSFDDPESAF